MKRQFNDTWLRILGIPLLAFCVDITATYREIIATRNFTGYPLYFFILLIIFMSIIWHINLFIHFKVRKYYERFNDKRKFMKGWLVRLVLYGVNTAVIIFLASLILNDSEKNIPIRFFEFLQTLSYGLLFSYLIAGPLMFFRINRQFLVAIHSIANIHTYFNGRLKLELRPPVDKEVIVSRERVNDFKDWMGS